MLIESNAPISINGVEVLQNVKLNIAKNHQMRFKAAYKAKKYINVDVVVYNWTSPKIDKLTLGITAEGKEMIRGLPFSLKLSYDFLRSHWKLNGSFGQSIVNRELASLGDLIVVFRDLV